MDMQTLKNLFYKIRRRWFELIKRKLKQQQEIQSNNIRKPYSTLVQLKRAFISLEQSPSVLCLGDSVWERIAREDVDQRSLGQMLSENLKQTISVTSISQSAYNMRVYLNIIKVLEKMRHYPRLILLPINLRSFSPQWFLNPLWQSQREIQVLEEYRANPKMKLPVIEPVRETPELFKSFDAFPVDYPNSEFSTVGQFRKLIASKPADEAQKTFRLKQIFIFHYMYILLSDHPLIRDMNYVLQKLSQMDIGVLLIVTPINYQAGMRFVGSDFLSRVELNVQVIFERINSFQGERKPYFMDYSKLLSSKHFFHPADATEHLNQTGRTLLSERLASMVTAILAEWNESR